MSTDDIMQYIRPLTEDERDKIVRTARVDNLLCADDQLSFSVYKMERDFLFVGERYQFADCTYATITRYDARAIDATLVRLENCDIPDVDDRVWVCTDLARLSTAVAKYHRQRAERALGAVFDRLETGPSNDRVDLLRDGIDNIELPVNDWITVKTRDCGLVGLFSIDLPYRRWYGIFVRRHGDAALRYVDTDSEDEVLWDLAYGLMPGDPARPIRRSIDELEAGALPYEYEPA